MLNIRYIPDFKSGQPFLVIRGNKEGFLKAASFFRHRSSAVLNDNAVTEYCDVRLLETGPLYLTEKECKDISQHFENLVANGEPCHAYMDIAVLKDAEILISYGEYASGQI